MRKILLMLLGIISISTLFSQEITGTWKGILNAGNQKLEIFFNFNTKNTDKISCSMDIPVQSAKGIPVELDFFNQDSVSMKVSAINMTYNGKLKEGIIYGTFNQMGMSFPLELKKGEVEKPKRPQEPVKPYAYKTEEITFENPKANAKLSATLTYPIGYRNSKKVPVIIMVTGSGAQNRDEEIFEHKPFLVIADFLAKHGIASLRYDDRGVGKSTGKRDECTSKDFAEDAEYGLQWLRNNRNFNKIGVLGHSEGGTIAFMLGAEKKVDFIVSMAGTGIKGDTLLAEQYNAILKIKGIPSTVDVNTVRKDIKSQPKNHWLDFFINYDPKADIERITIPVMAINGSNDAQVISKSNLTAIKELLSNGNNKNIIKEYPNLNHLFQHCTKENSLDYYNIEETCSEEVLNDIANWINGL